MYVSCFGCVYSLFSELLDYHSNSKNRNRAEILSKECSKTGFWGLTSQGPEKHNFEVKELREKKNQGFSAIVELNTQQPIYVQPLPKACKKKNTRGWDEQHLEQGENNSANFSSVIRVTTSKTHKAEKSIRIINIAIEN